MIMEVQKSTGKMQKMKSKKLNICVLPSTPFDPDMPAGPAVTEIYGKYLPSFGHKVIWITPSMENGKEIHEVFFKEVKIYETPYRNQSSLIAKILNKLQFLVKEYRLINKILKQERFDIIQVRNSALEALLVLHIKKRHDIPFVFQYTMPRELYKFFHPGKNCLYYFGKFESYIKKYILRKADFMFPISKWMEKELIGGGIQKSKMMALPMGVNPELFSLKKDGTKIRKMYELDDSQIILYIGAMVKPRQLNILIYAFSKVRDRQENVKLLMVGEGDDKTNLEELASFLGIQNDIIFTGQVPYFDMPYFIAAADVSLCPVPPLSIYKVSSPTKLFEYMAMGKPIVANEEIPEQKEVIEESGGGILVKFDGESFASGIIELLDNPNKAKEMGRKGHEWVVKNRSYENMAREVEKKYYELLETYNKGR